MLQATDAGQLGDLGILDLKILDNDFLYVYVTNQSEQVVDFDNLTIIQEGGRCLEENHYYPYGMLIEGLSFNSGTAPNDYKFNGVQYETNNNLFNYLATYRSYDPAIAKWNQLDPMNQFSNGYFAYGGNPVSLADPLGLSVNSGGGGGNGSDLVNTDRKHPLDDGRTGGGGATSADGSRVDFSEQIAGLIAASIKDGTYGTSAGTNWNINHMLMASGGSSSFVSNPTKITGIRSNGGTITFSTPDFFAGDIEGINYSGSSNFYMHTGDYDGMYIKDNFYSVKADDDLGNGLSAFDFAAGVYSQYGHNHNSYTTTKGIEKSIFKPNGQVSSARAAQFAKASYLVKGVAFVGSAVSTTYSGYKVYNQIQTGGLQNVNGWDVTDFGVGALGVTGTALVVFGLTSNPIGWGIIGTGALIYGGVRLGYGIYDDYIK